MDKTKSNQARVYNNVDVNTQRTNFPLGFKNRMTLNFNKLVPSMKKMAIPGDAWHFKTIFFSRWLQMVAPAFVDYEIKFNNFFCAYTQVWAGFQQFIGEGDDQAAQYLLSPSTARNDMRVPYTSSKTIALMGWNRVLQGLNASTLAKNGLGVGLTTFARKFFRLVAVPTLCYKASFDSQLDYLNVLNDPMTYDDLITLDKSVKVLIMLWPKDDYTQTLIEQGAVYDLDSNDLDTFMLWFNNISSDWCGVYSQFNYENSKEIIGETAVFEIPQDAIPMSQHFIIENSGQYTGACSVVEMSYGSNCYNAWFGCGTLYQTGTGEPVKFKLNDDGNRYMPCGYLFAASQDEFNVVGGATMEAFYYRTVGQFIVKKVLGVGTLMDYFGKVYEHQLLRQPFDVAAKLLECGLADEQYYPTGEYSGDFNENRNLKIKRKLILGTYSESSPKLSVGVVNDEPISLLDILCYKKVWSDYFRDPRYELRDVYADPYHSPFMQPFADGTYLQGAFLFNLTADDTFDVLGCVNFGDSYDDDWEETERDLICNTNPFTLSSFIDFFELKERRCVHDFFTLMTPQSQYGDEVLVDSTLQSDGSLNLQRLDDHSVSVGSSGANLKIYNSGNVFYTDSNDGNQRVKYNGGLMGQISVKALRLATRIQKFMERSNFVGSDYVKQILAHYGVNVDHCQHCRVDFLGGDGGFKATVSPVEMVGASTDQQTTGQQSANAYCSGKTSEYIVHTNEFGCLLQLLSVQNVFATITGQQRDCIEKYDFPFPEFANLGAQSVPLSRVCMTDGSPVSSLYDQVDTNPNLTFGYQPRYAEYKCSLDEVHGDFRKSLAYWVSTREFNPSLLNGTFGLGRPQNLPELGKNFLYENPDYGAFINQSEDFSHVLMDIEQYVTCSRLFPYLPNPNVL